MPANRKLFMPADGLSLRDPLTNEQRKGNIMNPRRYAEFGGATESRMRSMGQSSATVQTPESTQRAFPSK